VVQRLRLRAAGLYLIALTTACAAPERSAGAADVARDTEAKSVPKREVSVTNEALPPNQQFRTLDEYLAHLERHQGPVDGPWYRQVKGGLYELQTGNLRILGADGDGTPVKQTFTREELERKFGFRK